jgi:hypothetical protein
MTSAPTSVAPSNGVTVVAGDSQKGRATAGQNPSATSETRRRPQRTIDEAGEDEEIADDYIIYHRTPRQPDTRAQRDEDVKRFSDLD